MDDIIKTIVTAAQQMSLLEVAANIAFATSVILCNFRRWENYLFGFFGTAAFFFVFWQANLYSLALLQLWLIGCQLYGLWFWLRGAKGKSPPISKANWKWWAAGGAFTLVVTQILSTITAHFGAEMAYWDALLFSMSVVAQFFLDRKKIENWFVWIAINTVSIPLFWSQGLYLTSIIYAGFWVNAIVAYFMWRGELKSYAKPAGTLKIDGQEFAVTSAMITLTNSLADVPVITGVAQPETEEERRDRLHRENVAWDNARAAMFDAHQRREGKVD